MPNRRILVVRHGERCDYFFLRRGINWMTEAFDDEKNYFKFHEEMPESIPVRSDGADAYSVDTPLTKRGYQMAVDAGRLFNERNITIDFLYVSPAFRCIQTAKGILQGLGNDKLQMFVEPGLFQFMRWCENHFPRFMSITDLLAAGLPISATYKPFGNVQCLRIDETLDDYYERSYALMKHILAAHRKGTILCVAHAGSLNTLTQQLCRKPPLLWEEFTHFLKGTSYLSCEEIQEQEDFSWKSFGSPIPKLSNSGLDKC